jgi:hypothetical protein
MRTKPEAERQIGNFRNTDLLRHHFVVTLPGEPPRTHSACAVSALTPTQWTKPDAWSVSTSRCPTGRPNARMGLRVHPVVAWQLSA